MYLGRVIGRLWCTVQDPGFVGQRLLIVQPLTPELTPTGKNMVVTDAMGAGTGDLVYWVRGREATLPFQPAQVVTDYTIVGVVDQVRRKRQKAPGTEGTS